MSLSSNAGLGLSAQLSVLATRLETRCQVPGGWPADAIDSELFANYVAIFALCAAGRRATPQLSAASQKLRSMRLPSGLWRIEHANVEPTSRAVVALQLAEAPPSTDLGAAIRHIQAQQQKDGGWALEGTHVVTNPHSEVGPSLPCTLALRQAQAHNADKTVSTSLVKAQAFFKTQVATLANEAGKDAKTDIAYAWAVRGLVNASMQLRIDEADAHRDRLEQIVLRILQRGSPPDDTGFQLLFNALHSLALLVDAHTATSSLDIEEATSCLLAWALLRDVTNSGPTRWLAGALLAGAIVMARRHPGASLFGAVVVPNSAAAAAEGDGSTATPADSFVAAILNDLRRRPTSTQVFLVSSTVSIIGAAAASVFGLGLATAPRLDESTRNVAARLVGNLEVIVKDKSTGQPIPGARLEMRPVSPERTVGEADATGKAHMNWNLVDPPSSAVRIEVLAQRPGGPTSSKILPDKPASTETIYVP